MDNSSIEKSGGGDATTSSISRSRSLFATLPREVDVFGFIFSIKHSLIIFFLCIIMCGPLGTCLILVGLGLYNMSQRSSSLRQNRYVSRGFGGRSGANIRGVKDLPPSAGGC